MSADEVVDASSTPFLGRAKSSNLSNNGDGSSSAIMARRRLSTMTKFSTALAQDDNEENIEQKQGAPVLSKLPTPGFNRIKTLWAKRESTAGFSSPLSTWSRNYAGSNRKLLSQDEDGSTTSNRQLLTKSGAYDPDRVANHGLTFLNFGHAIQQVPRIPLPGYQEEIPLILVSLRELLEQSGGFNVEGVFRVAASLDDQRSIKQEMDIGKFAGCKSVDDSMCIAALIKEWFRTLAPSRILNSLPVESVRTGKPGAENDLPEPQRSVFLWLVDLMADVCKLEYINRMSPRAMAIVIAPNLYDAARATSPQDIIQEMNGATTILEAALRSCLARRAATAAAASEQPTGIVAEAVRNKEMMTTSGNSPRADDIAEGVEEAET